MENVEARTSLELTVWGGRGWVRRGEVWGRGGGRGRGAGGKRETRGALEDILEIMELSLLVADSVF